MTRHSIIYIFIFLPSIHSFIIINFIVKEKGTREAGKDSHIQHTVVLLQIVKRERTTCIKDANIIWQG